MARIIHNKNRTNIGFIIALVFSCLLIIASHDAMAVDDAGQGAKVEAGIIDKTPPAITIDGVQEGVYYSSDVRPAVKVFDEQLSIKKLTLNGSAYDGAPVTRDGNYTLKVNASDLSGNRSSKTLSFVLDKTSPVITVTGVDDGRYYNSNALPVITVRDANLKEKDVALNGSSYDGAPITRDGNYTLKVDASDLSGNRSSKTLSFVMDKTSPVITVTGVDDGRYYNSNALPVITVRDANLKEKRVTLNGSSYDGAPITRDGNYTLKVEGSDLSGNRSSKTLSFVMDKTSPVITVTGVDDGRYYNSNALPVITVRDANLKEKNVTLNGRTYPGSVITEEGSIELKVDAVDMAGNKSFLTHHFKIDKTLPVSTMQIGLPMITDSGKLFISGSTPLVLAASDSGTGSSGINRIEYSLNDTSWNIYKKSISLGSREGAHKISFRSIDNAGNMEAVKQSELILDNGAPVTLINAGEPKLHLKRGPLLVTQDTEFTLNASDNFSGVAKTEYRVNNAPWNARPSFKMAKGGRQLIEYRGTDRLGNTEPAKSLEVIVDNTAPVTNLSIGSPKFSISTESSFITGSTVISLTATDAFSEVAATEYRIDADVWTSYVPVKIQTEGEHLIEYRSRDQIGNLEEIRSATLIVDNTPPVSIISTGSPNFTNSSGTMLATGKTVFSISASDNLAGVAKTEYRIDDSAWKNYSVPFSVPTEGKHIISYRSIDNTGNAESVLSLSITIDNTSPVTAINVGKPKYESGGALFITGITAVSLNSTDNIAGLKKTEYRIDNGEWTAFNALIDLSSLSDGKHSIGYRSSDNVDNIETEKVLMIVIDNTPPLARINPGTHFFTSADGVNYVTSQTSLTMNVTDTLSGVMKAEYRLDNAKWLLNAPFTISSEGSHLIESRNSDNLGNFETAKSLSVTVDNTPPVTIIAVGTPGHDAGGAIFVSEKTEFILNGTDNLSGIKQAQYRINGGGWTVYAAPFNLKSLPDGKQTIGYRSVDNLGNTESEKTMSVVLDNTTPLSAIKISDPIYTSVNNVSYITSATTFSLSAKDNLSGLKITEYRIDDGQWLPASTFSINSEGKHKIAYRSTDNVGNVEAEKIISMTVDNTPPVTGIASKDLKYKATTIYATSKTEFILSAIDDFSGVKETDFRIDISAWVTGTTKYTLSATENNPEVKVTEYKTDSSAWITGTTLKLPIEGTHTIGYRSRDNIGNLETEKNLTVIIDNIPPYTTIDFSRKYNDGSNLLVSRNSQVTLNASDGLSGIKTTYYRFDNLKDWHTYSGPFELTELSNGIHTIYYKTVDNVDNSENEKNITIKTIGRD